MFIARHLRSLFVMLHDLWCPLNMINEPRRQETRRPPPSIKILLEEVKEKVKLSIYMP